MRTIKFRGLKPDGKGWVYGYFLKPYTECIIVDSESDIKPPPYMVVIPESVGQFTGLKDKNGVEIYEGDMFIINGKVYFVEWGEDLAGFRLTTGKGYDSSNTLDFNCDSIYYSKAIGNIDENEDLLNESTKDIK